MINTISVGSRPPCTRCSAGARDPVSPMKTWWHERSATSQARPVVAEDLISSSASVMYE